MKTDPKRGTGRTTRMLQHARDLAEDGRAVYVIADNANQAAQFKEVLPSYVSVECGPPRNLDFDTLTLKAAHPNCVVLIDHFFIERRFHKVWEMLHRYDDPRSS